MKLVLLCGIIALYSQVRAQMVEWTEVPAKVINTFEAAYPQVNKVQWKRMGSNYKATCVRGVKAGTFMVLDPSGTIIETMETISSRKLPHAAQLYIKAAYPGNAMQRCYKITGDKALAYRVQLEDRDIFFDAEGTYRQENMNTPLAAGQ